MLCGQGLVLILSRHLKPGGYIEFVDGVSGAWMSEDGTYKSDGNWAKYVDLINKASDIFGIKQKSGEAISKILSETGFDEIVHSKFKMPIGLWPKNPKQKEIGRWGLAVVEPSVEAYGLALFTRALGMTEKEAHAIMDKAKADLHQKSIHMIFPL